MIEYEKRIEDSNFYAPTKVVKEEPKLIEKTALTRVNVRKGAGMDREIVKVLEKGEKILVFDTDGEWTKTENGRYIMSKFLG